MEYDNDIRVNHLPGATEPGKPTGALNFNPQNEIKPRRVVNWKLKPGSRVYRLHMDDLGTLYWKSQQMLQTSKQRHWKSAKGSWHGLTAG